MKNSAELIRETSVLSLCFFKKDVFFPPRAKNSRREKETVLKIRHGRRRGRKKEKERQKNKTWEGREKSLSWPIKKRKEMGKLFLSIWEYGKKKNATDVRTMNPDLPYVKKTKKVERNIRETRVALKRGGSDGTKKRES